MGCFCLKKQGGYTDRSNHAANVCQAVVIPMGTEKAPTANVKGAAQAVER